MAKCKIVFNQDVHVISGVDKRVLYDYRSGQVAEVEHAERMKWLNRGFAADYTETPKAEAPERPDRDEARSTHSRGRRSEGT